MPILCSGEGRNNQIPYGDQLWTVPVLRTNQMPPQQLTTTIQIDGVSSKCAYMSSGSYEL